MKVTTKLASILNELNGLPELPANVELEVRTAMVEFITHVRSALQSQEFSASYAKTCAAFKNCLLHTKPRFTLRDASDMPTIDLTVDDESDAQSTINTPSRRRPAPDSTPTGAKRARLQSGTPLSMRPVKSEEGDNSSGQQNGQPRFGVSQTPRAQGSSALEQPFTRFMNAGSGFRTLAGIRSDIMAKRRAGRVGDVPVEVKEDLCKLAVKVWKGPLMVFLDATMHQVKGIIDTALQTAFGNLQRRVIFRDSTSLMKAFLDKHYLATKEFLESLYDMENYQFFTLNDEAFGLYKEREQAILSRFRHHQRWQAYTGDFTSEFVQDAKKLSDEQRVREERSRAVEQAKLGPDPFEQELGVASYVRAYYWLASLRFSDIACMAVASRMFPQIIKEVNCYLDKELGLLDSGSGPGAAASREAAFARLMDEDNTTARKREQLKRERVKFEKAMESIEELERQSGPVEMATPEDDSENIDTMELDGSI